MVFDVYLGWRSGVVKHWCLVFIHKPEQQDDSIGCPEDCNDDTCDHPDANEDFFYLDLDTDDFVPHKSVHIVHVIRDSIDDDFIFSHTTPGLVDPDLSLSPRLGYFNNARLPDIVQSCSELPMPATEDGEHCQDWVWKAMGEVISGEGITRENNWEKTLAAHV
jgi:hypothetical protein